MRYLKKRWPFPLVILIFHFSSVAAFTVKQNSFTLPSRGQRLTGTILASKPANTAFMCAKQCMTTSECSAYSFSEVKSDCQLMRSSDVNGTVADEAYNTIMRKLSCDDDPCKNGGNCHRIPTLMTDVVAYRCTCPCGRCGYNCDSLNFSEIPDACIYMFNAGYQKVSTQQECMLFCWETKGCRSADYIVPEGSCWLNSVTAEEEPLTVDCDKWYPGVAYLFFNCTCEEF